MMEVVYRQSDGSIVRTLAFYSHRRGPLGEWMLGDTPLREFDGGDILHQGERLTDEEFDRLLDGAPRMAKEETQ